MNSDPNGGSRDLVDNSSYTPDKLAVDYLEKYDPDHRYNVYLLWHESRKLNPASLARFDNYWEDKDFRDLLNSVCKSLDITPNEFISIEEYLHRGKLEAEIKKNNRIRNRIPPDNFRAKIFHMSRMERGRNLNHYAQSLGFKEIGNLLKWISNYKVVGDIGSGQGNFSKDIKALISDQQNVNMPLIYNIDFVDYQEDDSNHISVSNEGKINLPNESLDAAVAVYSAGLYVSDVNNPVADLSNQFSEAFRILKPNGELIVTLGAVSKLNTSNLAQSSEEAMEAEYFRVIDAQKNVSIPDQKTLDIVLSTGFEIVEKIPIHFDSLFEKEVYGIAIRLKKPE